MEHNRIQKLLLSEYCDFSDRVLIESPFAETTRDGDGLREVALGLTPSRLVIAADILKENSEFMCPPGLDASIESFELVSVYPLEFITLSVFRRRRRKTLKARLIDGRAKYYELGGLECKNVYWSHWCENVRKLLAEKQDGSSMSETTAASSSSASTLFLLSSDVEFRKNAKHLPTPSKCRVWARYGGAGDGQSSPWLFKDLYLGPTYNELSHGYYTPIPVRFAGASLEDLTYELKDATPKTLTCKKTCSSWPCSRNNVKSSKRNEFQRGGGLCDVLFTRERKRRQRGNKSQKSYRNKPQDSGDCDSLIFGDNDHRTTASDTSGISPSSRRCSCQTRQKRRSGSPRKHELALAPKLSRFGFGIRENCRSGLYLEPWEGDQDHFRHIKSGHDHMDVRKLIDNAVSVWESNGVDRTKSRTKMRHPRRYGLATAAHFFHALGPWSVQHGERESVQRKRASSVVCIRRQPMEPELRLPVSKRQLATSVSMTSLEPGRSAMMSSSTKGRVVLFWTPEYWYRPRAATAAYRELRRHLSLLRDFRVDKESSTGRKRFFGRRKRSNCETDCRDSTSATITEEKSSGILGRIFSSKDTRKKIRKNAECRDVETSQLRRLLRMDLRITAWDLDSSTLASQLTLIDRDLFLRIPCVEIEILVSQRSSRNSPNLGAWIAFSHRISCLTASEVLATKKLVMRTRILARFINAADKCYALGNFHSCRSILAGLQSPPIYRLKSTWSHLRTHHSIRYETMERLCKMFNNTKTRTYRRAWKRCERSLPALPYVGDIISRILSDDEERAFLSKLNPLEWNNRPCHYTKIQSLYTKGEVSSILESACNRIVSNSISGNKMSKQNSEKNVEKETLVDNRSPIARFFFSAARIKIGNPKCESPSTKTELKDYPWTGREHMLAHKFFSRWRRHVLTSKILAENEDKLRAMPPKRRKIIEISTWMCDCQRQAQGYNFPGHSLAWEFLLKARYREDRENFFISLKLEPPCP